MKKKSFLWKGVTTGVAWKIQYDATLALIVWNTCKMEGYWGPFIAHRHPKFCRTAAQLYVRWSSLSRLGMYPSLSIPVLTRWTEPSFLVRWLRAGDRLRKLSRAAQLLSPCDIWGVRSSAPFRWRSEVISFTYQKMRSLATVQWWLSGITMQGTLVFHNIHDEQ